MKLANEVEYRETIKLSPVLLRPNDLYELEEIIRDNFFHKNDGMKVLIRYNHVIRTAKSVSELLNLDRLPQFVDLMEVERVGWDAGHYGDQINRSVSISLNYNNGSVSLYSTDVDWYQGKRSRLKRFFDSRRPWYSGLNRWNPVFPSLGMLLIFSSAGLVVNGYLIMAITLVALAIGIWAMSVLIFKQKIFPYIRIYLLEQRPKNLNMVQVSVIATIIAAVAAVIQTIVILFSQ